jgi:glyceraldehyde 3-phosphate dehydrogenase
MDQTIRVGINGFGRMGRLALRAAWDEPEIEVVRVNEVAGDAASAAHLLEFDSVQGRWRNDAVSSSGDSLVVDGSEIAYSSLAGPGEVAWAESGVDLVIEATGCFRTPALLSPYFDQDVETVLVAAPVKEGALNIVFGVNHDLYDPETDRIVTAASCTTNCLAPVVKVLHEGLGIRHGSITTLHDVTNTQVVVDAFHKDLRRARAAGMSLIPTSTGSATAIAMIFPDLEGKLDGLAVRVPLLNSSITDCCFEVETRTSAEEVNRMLEDASRDELAGILGYEDRPLVSVDFAGDPRSGVVDGPSTRVINATQVKVLAFYDNEWGYANRMVDIVKLVASQRSAAPAGEQS